MANAGEMIFVPVNFLSIEASKIYVQSDSWKAAILARFQERYMVALVSFFSMPVMNSLRRSEFRTCSDAS